MRHFVCVLLALLLLVTTQVSLAEDTLFPAPVEFMSVDNSIGALLYICGIDTSEEGEVGVTYRLMNQGNHALTQVVFMVTYLDADGNNVRGKQITIMIGLMNEPLQPGESREFERRHYFDGAESTAAVEMEPVSIKDEIELPPWTEPRPGNLLLEFCNYEPFTACFENLDTNPPVQMDYHVDETKDETITDVDQILAEINSLKKMRIGEESDIRITDSGISYWFTMADGTEWGVSFEAPGLFQWHGKVYKVIND